MRERGQYLAACGPFGVKFHRRKLIAFRRMLALRRKGKSLHAVAASNSLRSI